MVDVGNGTDELGHRATDEGMSYDSVLFANGP
jgi:hypothetical protein